ncbi:demethoxyubiquinone hydroxylase family protein [Roseateles sp. LKC17W]|uniref:Demethoxyubiquinone hydroxylase family protein n=1 Tax=Pelomonas margarita TaxID=3299031 RepID=A0ABW7FN19_9BURK
MSAVWTPAAMPTALVADLRSDQAGETGAVWIYRGVLAVSRDPGLRAFAQRHLATERRHLGLIEACLPTAEHSRLLLLWRAAGWLTGALPALAGPRAVYGTVAAVESFVDQHYQAQVDHLTGLPAWAPLRELLDGCRRDEVNHRDEAAALAGPPSLLMRAWCRLVGAGSAVAVAVCRHV